VAFSKVERAIDWQHISDATVARWNGKAVRLHPLRKVLARELFDRSHIARVAELFGLLDNDHQAMQRCEGPISVDADAAAAGRLQRAGVLEPGEEKATACCIKVHEGARMGWIAKHALEEHHFSHNLSIPMAHLPQLQDRACVDPKLLKC